MYNLTVDVAHTYVVGTGQWIVHNSCPNVTHYFPPQAFSGAFDEISGTFTMMPSTNSRNAPPGWVTRRGGHLDVYNALLQEYPAIQAREGFAKSDVWGFTAIYDWTDAGEELAVTWTSRSLNTRSGVQDFIPPSNIQEQIMNALRSQTGLNVVSKP